MKPQRNRIADALRVHRPRADRIHIRGKPLGRRRLRDRLDRVRIGAQRIHSQRINSNLSFTRRSHFASLTAAAPPEHHAIRTRPGLGEPAPSRQRSVRSAFVVCELELNGYLIQRPQVTGRSTIGWLPSPGRSVYRPAAASPCASQPISFGFPCARSATRGQLRTSHLVPCWARRIARSQVGERFRGNACRCPLRALFGSQSAAGRRVDALVSVVPPDPIAR
jgi:hypothetical protein